MIWDQFSITFLSCICLIYSDQAKEKIMPWVWLVYFFLNLVVLFMRVVAVK